MLKKRDRIIVSIRKWQTRYLKKSQEFSIDYPEPVEQALALDAKNGNTLWVDAIFKEMEHVSLAFDVLPDGKSVPVGHQIMQCHVMYNVKLKIPDIRPGLQQEAT